MDQKKLAKKKRAQRLLIWLIAIVMLGGTLMTYLVVVVANKDQEANPTQIAYEKYLEKQQAEAAKQQAQNTCVAAQRENSQANLDQYKAAGFDRNVSELKVETLKAGVSEATTAAQCIDVNYKGWNTSGEVFDSGAYAVTPAQGGVIQGWLTGLVGLQVGGIYKLIIPSDQAYGATGSGAKIPANEPLTFVIEVVSAQ